MHIIKFIASSSGSAVWRRISLELLHRFGYPLVTDQGLRTACYTLKGSQIGPQVVDKSALVRVTCKNKKNEKVLTEVSLTTSSYCHVETEASLTKYIFWFVTLVYIAFAAKFWVRLGPVTLRFICTVKTIK